MSNRLLVVVAGLAVAIIVTAGAALAIEGGPGGSSDGTTVRQENDPSNTPPVDVKPAPTEPASPTADTPDDDGDEAQDDDDDGAAEDDDGADDSTAADDEDGGVDEDDADDEGDETENDEDGEVDDAGEDNEDPGRTVSAIAETFGATPGEVEALHGQGIGFGALFKLYKLAAARGMTVNALLAEIDADGGGFAFGRRIRDLTDDQRAVFDSYPKNLGQIVSDGDAEPDSDG